MVTPGNWKTMRERPDAIGIEAFSKPWKRSEKMEKPA
jgi:hypothetical protein